jgi:hypothetical protein
MKIQRLPRARHDETFSSWLYRMHIKRKSFNVFEYCNSSSDPDVNLSGAIFFPLCGSGKRQRDLIQCFFRLPLLWLLPWESRVAYCSSCLREDITRGGIPYWRRSWCMLHMPICAVHCQLLSLYITERPGPDKAWLAFSVDCRRTQTTEYRNRQFPSRYFGTPRRLILLALRVQRFLNTAMNTGAIWLSSVQQRISTDWLLIFVNFLFGNFLFPRTRNFGPPGLARGHQFGLPREYFPNITEARLAALHENDPYARVIALILVGRVLGLIDSADIKKVVNEMYTPATLFECAPEDIARYGLVLFTESDRLALKLILYQAPSAAAKIVQGLRIAF